MILRPLAGSTRRPDQRRQAPQGLRRRRSRGNGRAIYHESLFRQQSEVHQVERLNLASVQKSASIEDDDWNPGCRKGAGANQIPNDAEAVALVPHSGTLCPRAGPRVVVVLFRVEHLGEARLLLVLLIDDHVNLCAYLAESGC